MTESNAILELKAKNDKLKAELKRQKWLQNGRIQESIERKNVALDTLHMVWCSGGCGDIKVTAEMVAFVEEYAKRLRTWYINHADRIDPIVQGFAPPINHSLVTVSVMWYGMKAGVVFWQAFMWGAVWEWWLGKVMVDKLFMPFLGGP